MVLKEVLQDAVTQLGKSGVENNIQKAGIIISNKLGMERNRLLINENLVLEDEKVQEILSSIQKLSEGFPLQYITNKAEFMKLNFYVDENVLIPQPDTETLVEEIISCRSVWHTPSILDMCTGSGAIAISLAEYIPDSIITAADISKEALEVAKKNASINKVKNISFVQSDMFKKINTKYDAIVSNPPYIRTEVIPTLNKDVRCEPTIALDGGIDGLKFYRELIDNAHKYLNNDGYLFMEVGYDQKESVLKLINESQKYKDIYFKKDLGGNDRVCVCKKSK